MFTGLKSLKGRFALCCVSPCLGFYLEFLCMFLYLFHSLSQLFSFDFRIAYCLLILTLFLFLFLCLHFLLIIHISFYYVFFAKSPIEIQLSLFSYVRIKNDPCRTQKKFSIRRKPKLKVRK